MFDLHEVLVGLRFKVIEAFIEHSREGMHATWKAFSKRFDCTTAGWSDDEIADYVDYIYDDLAMVRDESPQLLRHAQCMILYGAFETRSAACARYYIETTRSLHRRPGSFTWLK